MKIPTPPEERLIIQPHQFQTITEQIQTEIESAEILHPRWPLDVLHGICIVGEEFGEAMQAAIDLSWSREFTRDHLRAELIQTAATIFRLLAALDRQEKRTGTKTGEDSGMK